MKNRTDEQLRAIECPAESRKPVLVSAAAGSGKTAVLVERVVRLLCSGEARADRIVLVTFTRKAANEMKIRLEQALRAVTETPLIRKQLIRLEEAQITTINAFCLGLLRDNFGLIKNETGFELEAGFKVAEEEDLELIAKQAMSEMLEQFYEGDMAQIKATCAFFGANGDSGLQRAVRDLYAFTRNLPDSEGWLNGQLRLFGDADRFYEEVVPKYYGLVKADMSRAIALTEQSLELAEFDKTRAFLEGDLAFFKEERDDFPRMSLHKDEDESVKAQIKENRAKTKKIKESTELARVLIADFKNAVKRLQPVVAVLVDLYGLYADLFTKHKRMNKVLDFPDSEHLCLALLRNESARKRISENYELIIVDEFQDSNFLQYELFKLLDNGRNRLYMVGDIKQSIYGFRGADSAVFDEVSRNPDYELLHLSMNFRSSEQVVESVNAVFTDGLPLRAGRGINEESYKTELVLLEDDTEAEYTALRIKQMIAESESLPEPFGYGDFAVLTSAGEKNFKVYERVFAEHGIPCVSAGGGGYLKTEEIGLALDLLMVISNPYNDLSLFNIMMSPLFGFTAEEMAGIRAGRKRMPLFSAVLAASRVNPSERVSKFLLSIAKYRRLADISSAAELISVINADKGFEPLAADGYKRANVKLLSYYAERFSQGRADCGLPSFLAYIRGLRSVGVDVRQANVNSKSRGAVRLMTIHGAKGLEFPVCFVGRVNTLFTFRGDNSALVKFDKTAGIVADWFDSDSLCRFKTLFTDYERRLNREFTVAEERRKLYVAATRAERKLIFTGHGLNVKENSYLNWLVGNVEQTAPTEGEVDIVHVLDNAEQNGENDEVYGEYARKVLSTVPRKMTATQVGVEFNSYEYDEPQIFPRNPSFYGEKRLTGKKRGDAYHKAMAGEKLTEFERNAVDFNDIARFWESPLGLRASASGKVEKEYKLYTEIELSELSIYDDFPDKPFIQGIADMFFYEEDGIVLVDYKTNRNTTAERLVRDYRGQLLIYKKAIEEMTGVRVKECWLYSFELGGIEI
jgi:ATP-dependent helicase/nuclease subunit A